MMKNTGAGSGNRTRTLSLEGSYDTISPYPLEGFSLYFTGPMASSVYLAQVTGELGRLQIYPPKFHSHWFLVILTSLSKLGGSSYSLQVRNMRQVSTLFKPYLGIEPGQ